MQFVNLPKILILIGVGLVITGVALYFIQKMGIPLGKLPGDLEGGKEGSSWRFPVISCLLISALLTLLINFFLWIFRK